MSDAPERIWAFHTGPLVGLFIGKEEVGSNVDEYVRADIHTALKARNARLVEALASAYDAGFAASAEGYNGEYGADPISDYYIKGRAAAVGALHDAVKEVMDDADE